MGAGASSGGYQEQISAATPRTLGKAFNELGAEDQAKVKAAMESGEQAKVKPAVEAAGDDPNIKKLVVNLEGDFDSTMASLQEKVMAWTMTTEAEGVDPSSGEWDMNVLDKTGAEIDGPGLLNVDSFPVTFQISRKGCNLERTVSNFTMKSLEEFIATTLAARTASMTVGTSESAPFLREFFKKWYTQVSDACDMEKVMAMAFDSALQKKEQERMKAFFNAECKPLLEKSFAKHDTDSSGTLSSAEATKFFANFAVEHVEFVKAVGATAMMGGVQMSLAMMMSMVPPEAMKEMTDDMKKQIENGLKELDDQIAKTKKEYEDDKDARNAAAFTIIDSSGDGTLQLSEFLAAFEPESEKNKLFMAALGFEVAPAAAAAGPGVELKPDEDADCGQM